MSKIIVGMVLFLVACGSRETPPPKLTPADSLSNIVKDSLPVIATEENAATSTDSIIVLEMKGVKEELMTDIKADYQQIHVRVPVGKTQLLKAVVNPEGAERNIRISQIEMPDGKTDGPFERSLEYKTPKEGIYTLFFGRNNMADGKVTGPVKIQLVLE